MDTATLLTIGLLGLLAIASLLVAMGLQYNISCALRQSASFRTVAVPIIVSFCLLLIAAAASFGIYVIVP